MPRHNWTELVIMTALQAQQNYHSLTIGGLKKLHVQSILAVTYLLLHSRNLLH